MIHMTVTLASEAEKQRLARLAQANQIGLSGTVRTIVRQALINHGLMDPEQVTPLTIHRIQSDVPLCECGQPVTECITVRIRNRTEWLDVCPDCAAEEARTRSLLGLELCYAGD